MPINIHGKQYITVAERVQEAGKDFLSLNTEVLANNPVVIKATVTTTKGVYTGISAANPKKQIEAQSPYEVAETSAVGRALGFAGYGIVEGIATADEVVKATVEERDEVKVQPSNLTSICKFHNETMVSAISKKSGKEYWYHKVNGEMCFGKGTDSERADQSNYGSEDTSDQIPF